MEIYKPTGTYRFIAEWEEECAIMVAMPAPHTDWDYILDRAQEQCMNLVNALLKTGHRVLLLCPHGYSPELHDDELLSIVETDYNDTWTRDYGPIAVRKGEEYRLLDFGFNAWGLKFPSDKDNLVNLHLAQTGVLDASRMLNCRDFILEGGSIETDGKGTLLTTTRCLCSQNRNGGASKEELRKRLQNYLGIDHILWLDYGALEGDDTDSHIDTLARMAPGDTIIYTGASNADDGQSAQLKQMTNQLKDLRTKEGLPLNLIELPVPDPTYDDEGNRLPATYANYLITTSHLFLPTYGQPQKDQLAAQILQSVFPKHKIIEIDCRTYLYQHGSLHCATMQIPLTFFSNRELV